MKRAEMYHKTTKPTKRAKAAAVALETPNPVKAADLVNTAPKPVPIEYPMPAGRVEVSWFLEALSILLAQVQEALADDGKIDAGEAWSIAMTLLNLVWELLAGKR